MIWSFILSNLKWIKWAAIAASAAVVAGGLLWGINRVIDLRADVAYWQAEAATWRKAAEHNALTVRQLRAYNGLVENELAREAQAAVKRAASVGAAKSEASNAPETDNGPIAPVLDRAIARVRELQAANSR